MLSEMDGMFREIKAATQSHQVQVLINDARKADRTTSYSLMLIAEGLQEEHQHQLALQCCEFAERFETWKQTSIPISQCNNYVARSRCYEGLGNEPEREFWLRRAYELADGEPLPMSTAWRIANELQKCLFSLQQIVEANVWRATADTLMNNMIERAARRRKEK